MRILWRHLWARAKPRLSYADLEVIFRFYATASIRNEPLATYVSHIADRDPTSDPVAELITAVAPRLSQVAAEKTKANQARECRVLLLGSIEQSTSDGYIAFKADESLRDVCLAARYGAELEEDVKRRQGDIMISFVNALWVEASLGCLYEELFNSYMPLDSFSDPYRAMTEMYTRLVCAKLFSLVMGEHDRWELQEISKLYEDACADSEVLKLAAIRKNYFDAIRKGYVEGLYPLQKHFAAVAASVQQSIEEAFDNPTSNKDSVDSELAQQFTGLYEAHQTIPESTERALPWSSNPGASEANLMRRQNNPYFPESRRDVSHADLVEAKSKDEEDFSVCRKQLEQLLAEETGRLAEYATSGDLLNLRERIDDLIFYSMGVGGPALEIASKADRLRDAVILDLRAAFSGDEETLSNIEKADTYHRDNVRRFYIPVVAQVLRKNSPIPKGETVAAILSEEPSAIAIFMNSLPEDARPSIEAEGLRMMQSALNEGYLDPKCEEKISALRGEWPVQRS